MEFLYPQFLYGLAALSIPIIVHLFNFRKAKKIYFSNNLFLKNVKRISSSKLKLKHYLILTARLLFIFFLVITFAQPFFPAKEKGLNNENVLIYLDNSLSMSNEIASDLSAFEAGLNYVDQITDLYPSNTRYALLTNDFAPFSNTLKSKDEAKELITELTLTGITRKLGDINNRLISGYQLSSGGSDIYVISDFQKSTVGDLGTVKLDSGYQFFFVPLQYRETSNVFVDSLFLKNPFLMVNENNELNVVLANHGNADVDEMIVKLFVNDVQSANATVSLKANSTEQIAFPLNFRLEKINECRIAFEEFPVTFDNDFYFTLNLMDRINILEIKNNELNSPIEKVYANKSLFNLLSYSITNLDYSLINTVDLIVLNGLEKINESLLSVLDEFIRGGGELLIVPAENPDLDSYNFLVRNELITLSENRSKLALATPDLNNPFYENIFEESNRQFDMPEARNVLEWNDRVNTLLTYPGGKPFLSGFNHEGGGNIYLLGAPVNENYTNFFKHAIFLPVMYRMAILSKDADNKLYFTLNENVINLKLDSLRKSEIYKLRNENGEVVPSQQQTGNELYLELPKFVLQTGFYDLTVEDDNFTKLAFNQDKNESRLEQYNNEELGSIFSGVTNAAIFNFDDVDSFSKEMKAKHVGQPFWKITLLLALFFLLIEILLIRFL